MTLSEKFWETKKLEEMTKQEWEALCDGCANCCRLKLEDEDTGAIAITSVVCHLLDCQNCQCSDYPNRHISVPDCIELGMHNISQLFWLPESCAYRRLNENKTLPYWHYLISGDRNKVHEMSISVQGRVVLENTIEEDDLPEFIEEIIAVE